MVALERRFLPRMRLREPVPASASPDLSNVYHHPVFDHNITSGTVTTKGRPSRVWTLDSRLLAVLEENVNRVVAVGDLKIRTGRLGSPRPPKEGIHRLRMAIGDLENPKVIVTVPRQGYMLVDEEMPKHDIYVYPGINGFPGYVHDPNRSTVEIEGKTNNLNPTENRLLCLLEKTPNRLVSDSSILKNVFGLDGTADRFDLGLIKVHMSHLRAKIRPSHINGSFGEVITRIKESGYRLNDPSRLKDKSSSAELPEWVYVHPAWTHYPERDSVEVKGENIFLTPRENALLYILEESPNRLVTKKVIGERLIELGLDISTDIKTYIYHLRRKLEPGNVKGKPQFLLGVKGGFVLVDPTKPKEEPKWSFVHPGLDGWPGYKYDSNSRIVSVEGIETCLTPMQNLILTRLQGLPGIVIAHDSFLDDVLDTFGRRDGVGILKPYIARLNAILNPEHKFGQPRFIISIPGVGYVLRSAPKSYQARY
ncbi:MAG: winged helix-turn-helix domain-containing protein [Candidatus Levybacteria bacterium]|nr:winged helix-turn-helix domain-containing protein [Candidatus Levybacteria bacterium]